MSWNEERVALLSKLWIEGLSASQIAKQLGGVTRNAVIGKVHRLGLQGRATPSRPAYRPARAARQQAPRAPRNRATGTDITAVDWASFDDVRAMWADYAAEHGIRNFQAGASAPTVLTDGSVKEHPCTAFYNTVTALISAGMKNLTFPAAFEALGQDYNTGDLKRIGWRNVQVLTEGDSALFAVVTQNSSYGGMRAKVGFEAQVAENPGFGQDDDGEPTGTKLGNMIYNVEPLRIGDKTAYRITATTIDNDGDEPALAAQFAEFKQTLQTLAVTPLTADAVIAPQAITEAGISYSPVPEAEEPQIGVIPLRFMVDTSEDEGDAAAKIKSGAALRDSIMKGLRQQGTALTEKNVDYLAAQAAGPKRALPKPERAEPVLGIGGQAA